MDDSTSSSPTVLPDEKDCVVRIARLDDYDAIMAISGGVYDGMDYLPAEYYRQIQDPKAIGYVIEYKGRVVGYRSLKLLDEQNTIGYGQSARVDHTIRGKGLLTILAKHSRTHFFGKYQNVKTSVWTALFSPIYERALKEQETRGTDIVKITVLDVFWLFIFFTSQNALDCANMQQMRDDNADLCNVETLDMDSVLEIIDNGELRRVVNTKYFVSGHGTKAIIWTKKLLREALQLYDVTATWSAKGKLRSISYAQTILTPRGVCVFLHHKGSSLSDFKAHVIHHALNLQSKLTKGQRASFRVSAPSSLKEDDMLPFLNTIFGSHHNSAHYLNNKGGLFEMEADSRNSIKSML